MPRSISEFVEFITISPPNTWYLYALALYFLLAKALSGIRPWLVIGLAAALSIVVAAGYVEIVSNRGSLLYNFTFFLLGVHFAPQIRTFLARVRLPLVASLVVVYLLLFTAMRLTNAERLPGVWPLVSVVGVAMGLAVAPAISRIRFIGTGLGWLGRRSLPIYLIHLPLVAIADVGIAWWLSDARIAVQFTAAIAVPVVLSVVVIAVCLLLNRLLVSVGATWLFDLPRWSAGARLSWTFLGRKLRNRALWQATVAVALVVCCGVVAVRTPVLLGCGVDASRQDAVRPGQVSIGATGDLLIHDVGHGVPEDGGANYFEQVRPWFAQDLVTGNLEQGISDDTGYDKCSNDADCLAFRSAPETARYFVGFDLVNMANNHTKDFGVDGYANTRANLAAHGIRTVGDRNEIACTTIGGVTVAVIGFAPMRVSTG